jgi:hypothetical protein
MGMGHGIVQGFTRIRYLEYRLEPQSAESIHRRVTFSTNRHHGTFLSRSELKDSLNQFSIQGLGVDTAFSGEDVICTIFAEIVLKPVKSEYQVGATGEICT